MASVRKMIAADRGEYGEEERGAQKEITLAEDIDQPTRWGLGLSPPGLTDRFDCGLTMV